jgi:hypothetical protein
MVAQDETGNDTSFQFPLGFDLSRIQSQQRRTNSCGLDIVETQRGRGFNVDLGDLHVTKTSIRSRSIRRLLAAVTLAAGGLALLTFGGGGRSQAYKEGWDYVVKSLKSGSTVGQAAAPFVDCEAGAAAKWPGTLSYGMQSAANYQKYSEWDQGCNDALNWVNSNGLNGLQIPYY